MYILAVAKAGFSAVYRDAGSTAPAAAAADDGGGVDAKPQTLNPKAYTQTALSLPYVPNPPRKALKEPSEEKSWVLARECCLSYQNLIMKTYQFYHRSPLWQLKLRLPLW